jgi:hypothetical protein
MSAADQKPPRKRATRTRRATPPKSKTSTYVAPTRHTDATTAAREHYHREKARRAERARPADHPLEQARRAYQELLAREAEQAKGGRPRKVVTAKPKRAGRHVDDTDTED